MPPSQRLLLACLVSALTVAILALLLLPELPLVSLP